jgi:FlaA1/EpsC-like NDP-sugar epimerase
MPAKGGASVRLERSPVPGQQPVAGRPPAGFFASVRGSIAGLYQRCLRVPLLRRTAVMVIHLALWVAAFEVALRIRFDGSVPPSFLRTCALGCVLLLGMRLGLFLAAGLADGLWRYAGVSELRRIVAATFLSSACLLLFQTARGSVLVPRGVLFGEWLASVVLVGGARLLIRLIYDARGGDPAGTATLVIGAGDAGESLLRDLGRMREGARWRVVGFLDDDQAKHGTRVHGARVLGAADAASLTRAVRSHAVELVILAWPSAPGARTRELLQLCRSLGVRTQTVPSLAERISGGQLPAVRPLDIDDLLGRDAVELDLRQVDGLLRDKVVLVTGAGGSIGSELTRQALRFHPRKLLLLDHDENALFFAERELREKFPAAEIVPLVADITDAPRVDWLFRRHRPAVVLHAAAHKHVGMMENNPCEAARNNVFGTVTVAEAAHAARSEVFILVSTDKAVNPSSVMGATKRVGEMVIQQLAQTSQTRFAGVRFGNVLGSAGSVVPIFREQIDRGGPVTVTHPEVSRYFMTISEAAQLVLQAAALTRHGEIFLLDMGEPVKIVDLARDLIELSGLRPEVDVQIEFSGLKPGEKLTEELLVERESCDLTQHPKIMVGRIHPIAADELRDGLAQLEIAILEGDDQRAREALSLLVPEATLDRPLADLQTVAELRAARRRAGRRDEALPTPGTVGRLGRRNPLS